MESNTFANNVVCATYGGAVVRLECADEGATTAFNGET